VSILEALKPVRCPPCVVLVIVVPVVTFIGLRSRLIPWVGIKWAVLDEVKPGWGTIRGDKLTPNGGFDGVLCMGFRLVTRWPLRSTG
jgi:hypothetical protein